MRLLWNSQSSQTYAAVQGVYMISATNRPDMIDPALLRPGRLDKILYVPLPGPADRAAILAALTRRTPLAADVDIAAVGTADACTGYSGADLAALVREACILALKVRFRCLQLKAKVHDAGPEFLQQVLLLQPAMLPACPSLSNVCQ